VAGFSNEQALRSGIRLVRSVAGWLLVAECRRAGVAPPLDGLLAQAALLAASEATFDAADPRFVTPPDMPTAIARAGALPDDASRAQLVRAAVDSMAATTMRVIESLPRIGAAPCAGIRVFGGGARADLYLDALRARTTLPVSTGPIEAAALGNALAQGVALGAYSSAEAARATLRAMEDDDR
jgi:rhamnulokinase